jgi:hypothetical protein
VVQSEKRDVGPWTRGSPRRLLCSLFFWGTTGGRGLDQQEDPARWSTPIASWSSLEWPNQNSAGLLFLASHLGSGHASTGPGSGTPMAGAAEIGVATGSNRQGNEPPGLDGPRGPRQACLFLAMKNVEIQSWSPKEFAVLIVDLELLLFALLETTPFSQVRFGSVSGPGNVITVRQSPPRAESSKPKRAFLAIGKSLSYTGCWQISPSTASHHVLPSERGFLSLEPGRQPMVSKQTH